MGYALAQAACKRSWQVDLVSGPVALTVPAGATPTFVETAEEMRNICLNLFPNCDLLLMAAAVCDHRPKSRSDCKLKKNQMSETLEMEPTPDILSELGTLNGQGQVLVGFAAETNDCEVNGEAKLREKNLDWIVVNEVGIDGCGFAADTNTVTLIGKNGFSESIGPAPKLEVAKLILGRLYP